MAIFGGREKRENGPVLPTHNGQATHHHRMKEAYRAGGQVPERKKRGYNSENPPKMWVQHFVAMAAEFVGTTLFLWFALSGTQIANSLSAGASADTASASQLALLYIALSFGFSLMANAWVFYRVSGGLFNPAVTLGLCLAGGLPWIRGLLLLPAQLLGSIVGAALVTCMFPGPHTFTTTLGHGASTTQGLFIEMFLTALLVITILMLAVEKSRVAPMAPLGIGLALFVAELSGVYYTGGSLNPARSFGPAVALRTFDHYHWIYWVGPLLGACAAAGFYGFAKYFNYEDVNPGQDAITDHEKEKATRHAERRASQRSQRSNH